LRYYEDGNFTCRVLPAPVLSEGGYADRPPARPDDWTGRVRATDSSPERDASPESVAAEEDEGGRGRHPELAEEGIARPKADRRSDDVSAMLDDDGHPSAQSHAPGVDPLKRSSPVQRAYGINAGDGTKGGHRGPKQDLLPGFDG